MIRPVTFVTAVMALSSGAWMFVVKHQAEQLDHRIGGVTAQIRAAEQRTRVLRAEWALETDPNRLARLAGIFLPQLKPMLPDQMVTWTELANRLPPAGAAIPHLPLPPPLPWELPDQVSGPGPVVADSAGAPVHLAAVGPQSRAGMPAILAPARRVARQRPAPVIHRVALPIPAHRPAHPTMVWRRPLPLGGSVLAPSRRLAPIGAEMTSFKAHAAPLPPPAARQTASVFGGYAANLPPPRPVGDPAP